MGRLCACYWTTKLEASVTYLVREGNFFNSNRLLDVEFDEQGVLDKHSWCPRAIKCDRVPKILCDENGQSQTGILGFSKKDVSLKLLNHITNSIGTNHWEKSRNPLLPLRCLYCSVGSDQHSLFNPTMRDSILLMLELDSFGETSKKKRVRRWMLMVDGSTSKQ